MARDLGNLTRREFLKGAAGAAVIPILGHSPRAHAQGVNAREIVSYAQHQHMYGGKGIDLQMGHGAPVTAPVGSLIYGMGKNLDGKRPDGGTLVWLEDDMGFLTQVAGPSKVFGQPGMRVGSLDIIAEEGKETKRGRMDGGSVTLTDDADVHTHIGRMYPKFAAKVMKFSYEDTYTDSTGIHYLVANPDEQSANKSKLLTSVYNGDNSANERMLAKAKKLFEEIADRNPDTFLGWYIRNSGDERIFPNGGVRFFPKTLVAAKLLDDNLIETPKLTEDVMKYLEWHVNAYKTEPGAGLFLPYVNPAIKGRYKVIEADAGRVERLRGIWNEADRLLNQGKNAGSNEKIKEFKKLAPIGAFPAFGGETGVERMIGLNHTGLNEHDKAVPHSLTAYALTTHYQLKDAEKDHFNRWLYWSLATSLRELKGVHFNKRQIANFFGLRQVEIDKRAKGNK